MNTKEVNIPHFMAHISPFLAYMRSFVATINKIWRHTLRYVAISQPPASRADMLAARYANVAYQPIIRHSGDGAATSPATAYSGRLRYMQFALNRL